MEDYQLVEKIAQFDRERIPERVVHARGASAKGFFEVRHVLTNTLQHSNDTYDVGNHPVMTFRTMPQVTHDISHLSCADVFRAPGVQTPVMVRFSTVIHERGSPETLRDPRGFAVKFYTR